MHDPEQNRVMAILTQTWGSAPQRPGAKMLISQNGFQGTLGGGRLELEVIKTAREILTDDVVSTKVEDFVLNQDLKQCCGGKVQVYFEKQLPKTAVYCFGAGHVGQQLAQILMGTQVELHVVDGREEWTSLLPEETIAHLTDPVNFIEKHQKEFGGVAVVMTHSHELDEKLIDLLASRGSFHHVGLIGSKTKWRRFQNRLENANLSHVMLQKVTCPVGVFKGKSKEPREIAISIAAQILQWVEEAK